MLTTFPERLKALRKKKGLSQTQLAAEAQVHVAQISRYERGTSNPAGEVITRLARALQTSADYLVSGTSDEAALNAGLDKELIARFKKVQALSREEKQVVLSLLDAFIAKQQIEQILQS